jgi:hypothetical protein
VAEFQWWLLLVGLVAGAALLAVVSGDFPREVADLDAAERQAMAGWIAERIGPDGVSLDPDLVAAVLTAEQEYLRLPPPDEVLRADDPALGSR